jgi:hypothetical protein
MPFPFDYFGMEIRLELRSPYSLTIIRNTTEVAMTGTFKEKYLTLTALYKDKALYLQHVYPTME